MPLGLLRRHVRDGPQHLSGLSDLPRERLGVESVLRTEPGEAEVQHFHAPVVTQHDVAGLQVSVRDPLLVRGGDGVGERDGDVEDAIERPAGSRDELAERFPAHELHRDEPHAAAVLDRVDRDDIGVIDGGDGLRFALEALAEFGFGNGKRRQSFEGDVTPEPGVFSEIDLAHASASKEADDAVLAECCPDHLGRRGGVIVASAREAAEFLGGQLPDC